MKTEVTKAIPLIAAIGLGSQVFAQSSPPWSQGFESFSNGNLLNQGSWTGGTGVFQVSSLSPYTGNKSIRIDTAWVGDYEDGHWISGYTEIYSHEVQYYPTPTDQPVIKFSARIAAAFPSYANLRFATAGIALVNAQDAMIAQVDVGWEGSWNAFGDVGAGVAYQWDVPSFDPWTKVTIALDFRSGALSVMADDVPFMAGGHWISGIDGVRIQAIGSNSPSMTQNMNQPIFYLDDLEIVTGPHCDGDFTLNGFVDAQDFEIFVFQYEQYDCASNTFGCSADLNADGYVDGSDFSIFADLYEYVFCD